MSGITILGSGHHVPGEPISNAQLARVMDTSDEWIRPRTGIAQRHYAREGEGVSDLGCEAAKRAIADAGLEPSEIEFILFATMTPEHMFPGSGGLLGDKLGIARVPALDIRQQCAAIPYALQVANGLVVSGAAKHVLIVGADAHAGFMPWSSWDILRGEREGSVDEAEYARATKHRGMAVLFGDGAGALVVGAAPEGRGFLAADLHTDGSRWDSIYIPMGFNKLPYVAADDIAADAHIPTMNGGSLLKTAVKELSRSVRTVCERAGVSVDDVDWFLAHQANDRINEAVRQALKLDPAKVPSNIARFGNTSAGTLGILTDELRRAGDVKEGQLVCFFALGAGLNWGTVLMRV